MKKKSCHDLTVSFTSNISRAASAQWTMDPFLFNENCAVRAAQKNSLPIPKNYMALEHDAMVKKIAANLLNAPPFAIAPFFNIHFFVLSYPSPLLPFLFKLSIAYLIIHLPPRFLSSSACHRHNLALQEMYMQEKNN